MKSHLYSLSVCVCMVAACGTSDQDKSPSGAEASSIASDSELANGAISSNLDSAVASMADSSGASTGTTLSLAAGANEKSISFTRECAESGEKAVVTLKGEGEHVRTHESKAMKMTMTMSGKSTQTRTWSREGSSVKCDEAKKNANIDWSGSLTGLKLDAVFTRERSRSMEHTHVKKGVTKTHSQSFSASGSHSVSWVDPGKTDDETSVYRKKNVTTKAEKNLKMKNSKGEEKDFSQSLATKEGAQLVVSVVRKKPGLAIVSKTVESGTLVAKNKDNSRLETSFSNLKITFENGQCTYESGIVTTRFYEKDAETESKSLKVVFENGLGTLTDEKTGETKDFAPAGCDPEDLD